MYSAPSTSHSLHPDPRAATIRRPPGRESCVTPPPGNSSLARSCGGACALVEATGPASACRRGYIFLRLTGSDRATLRRRRRRVDAGHAVREARVVVPSAGRQCVDDEVDDQAGADLVVVPSRGVFDDVDHLVAARSNQTSRLQELAGGEPARLARAGSGHIGSVNDIGIEGDVDRLGPIPDTVERLADNVFDSSLPDIVLEVDVDSVLFDP